MKDLTDFLLWLKDVENGKIEISYHKVPINKFSSYFKDYFDFIKAMFSHWLINIYAVKNESDNKFDEIMLMDNNILVNKEWSLKIFNWVIDNNLILREHGFDIRLLDKELAKKLLEIKFKRTIKFAFDDVRLKKLILKKIKMLNDLGFDLRNNVQFYVYGRGKFDFNSMLDRCNFLKENGTNAYIMCNPQFEIDQRTQNLKRWANRKWFYWKMPFEDFNPNFKS